MTKAKFQPPTEEERTRLCSYVKKGVYVDSALARCGIPKRVFNHWLKLGGEGIEPYKLFVEMFDDAIIACEIGLLEFVADAANKNKNVAAAQWIFNLRFGPKYKAIAEEDARRWKAENGVGEHLAAAKSPLSVEDVDAIERKALSMTDDELPFKQLTDLEQAKKGTFGLQ